MKAVSGDRARTQGPPLPGVDLGAESCRVSRLRWIVDQPELRLVRFFPNTACNEGHGVWLLRRCIDTLKPGVAANPVAEWNSVLSALPIPSEMEEKERLSRRNNIEEIQRPPERHWHDG